jgi:hypothetical protein
VPNSFPNRILCLCSLKMCFKVLTDTRSIGNTTLNAFNVNSLAAVCFFLHKTLKHFLCSCCLSSYVPYLLYTSPCILFTLNKNDSENYRPNNKGANVEQRTMLTQSQDALSSACPPPSVLAGQPLRIPSVLAGQPLRISRPWLLFHRTDCNMAHNTFPDWLRIGPVADCCEFGDEP